MSCVAEWFALLVALAAAVVSVISLLLSKRHAEDFTAGSHAIAHRELVWFVYNQELSETHIERILRARSPALLQLVRDSNQRRCRRPRARLHGSEDEVGPPSAYQAAVCCPL
jgi:hypothetical protein